MRHGKAVGWRTGRGLWAAAAYNLLNCGKTNATDADTPSSSAHIKPDSTLPAFKAFAAFFFPLIFISVSVAGAVIHIAVTEEDLGSLSHSQI